MTDVHSDSSWPPSVFSGAAQKRVTMDHYYIYIPYGRNDIFCEAVSESDEYFVREGDCIGYAVYVRDAGDCFVIETVGKYAYEFAICDAEEHLRFPYFYDFRFYLDTGLHENYFWSED